MAEGKRSKNRQQPVEPVEPVEDAEEDGDIAPIKFLKDLFKEAQEFPDDYEKLSLPKLVEKKMEHQKLVPLLLVLTTMVLTALSVKNLVTSISNQPEPVTTTTKTITTTTTPAPVMGIVELLMEEPKLVYSTSSLLVVYATSTTTAAPRRTMRTTTKGTTKGAPKSLTTMPYLSITLPADQVTVAATQKNIQSLVSIARETVKPAASTTMAPIYVTKATKSTKSVWKTTAKATPRTRPKAPGTRAPTTPKITKAPTVVRNGRKTYLATTDESALGDNLASGACTPQSKRGTTGLDAIVQRSPFELPGDLKCPRLDLGGTTYSRAAKVGRVKFPQIHYDNYGSIFDKVNRLIGVEKQDIEYYHAEGLAFGCYAFLQLYPSKSRSDAKSFCRLHGYELYEFDSSEEYCRVQEWMKQVYSNCNAGGGASIKEYCSRTDIWIEGGDPYTMNEGVCLHNNPTWNFNDPRGRPIGGPRSYCETAEICALEPNTAYLSALYLEFPRYGKNHVKDKLCFNVGSTRTVGYFGSIDIERPFMCKKCKIYGSSTCSSNNLKKYGSIYPELK